MADGDDEFLYMLQKVKDQFQKDHTAMKQSESALQSSTAAQDLKQAKLEITALRASLGDKEKQIGQHKKTILDLESDAKVGGGRAVIQAQVAELQGKLAAATRAAAAAGAASIAKVAALEMSLAAAQTQAAAAQRAAATGDAAVTAAAEAAARVPGDTVAQAQRLNAVKDLARKFKKKTEDLEAEATTTRLELERRAAAVVEFKQALGEAQRRIAALTAGTFQPTAAVETPEKIERVVELAIKASKLEEALHEAATGRRTAEAQAQALEEQVWGGLG
jgi:hypothetical protein